jgi:transposase-like protein
MAGVDDLLQLLPSLALLDLQKLGKAVEQAVRTKRAAAMVEPTERPQCPHCRAAAPWRWGKSGDVPRWRCRDCKKTFTALTGTPLAFAKRRPELLTVALDMLENTPQSCRKLADELEVHWITVWRWRLKVLRAINGWADRGLTGLVEADETFFRESRKGSREWSAHAKGIGPQPRAPAGVTSIARRPCCRAACRAGRSRCWCCVIGMAAPAPVALPH